jgi:hypothetical protein
MMRKIIGCVPAALAGLLLAGESPAQAATSRTQHVGIEHAQLIGALKLKGQLFHVQGVVVDGSHIWVTSVDKANRRGYLHQFDRETGMVERRIELTDGPRYHPGGISLSGRSIWVPVAEMKRNSSAVLDEIDIDTLQVRRRIAVADHLGCVAASSSTLIAGNWDSKRFYVFDLKSANDAPARVVDNPSPTKFQDMKLVGDQLIAGGQRGRHAGTIDWIDWPSLTITRSLHAGATQRTRFLGKIKAYTAEGMTLDGRELYLVPQDGPSRMFHFRLDT